MQQAGLKTAESASLGAGASSFDWISYWDQDKFWAQSKIWALNASLFMRGVSSFMNFSKKDSVLDIGCGPGFVAELLAPTVGSYAGADTSEALLSKARERCSLFSNASFKLLPEKYTELNTSQQFSVFLCVSVIQYYASISEVLDLVRSAQRISLPNGRMLLADIPQPRNFSEKCLDFIASLGRSVQKGYASEYLKVILRLPFSDYHKITKTKRVLEIPINQLAENVSAMGFKTTIIHPSVSICANRPSLLIQF